MSREDAITYASGYVAGGLVGAGLHATGTPFAWTVAVVVFGAALAVVVMHLEEYYSQ